MKECFIVLNRRAITSALIVLTSLNGQPIKAAAIQQAQFDANEAGLSTSTTIRGSSTIY